MRLRGGSYFPFPSEQSRAEWLAETRATSSERASFERNSLIRADGTRSRWLLVSTPRLDMRPIAVAPKYVEFPPQSCRCASCTPEQLSEKNVSKGHERQFCTPREPVAHYSTPGFKDETESENAPKFKSINRSSERMYTWRSSGLSWGARHRSSSETLHLGQHNRRC